MIVPARRRFPRSLNYRVRGFGDLATEGFEACGPLDTACVQRNAARGIARNQQNEIDRADAARAACERDAAMNPDKANMCGEWYPPGYAGGVIPAPNVQAMNPQAYAESFLTPDQAVANIFTPNDIGGFTYHPPIVVAPPVVPPVRAASTSVRATGTPSGSAAAPAAVTPGGQVIINSAGAQNAPGSSAGPSTLTFGGFSFSSVPWWAWAAGAGALFFFGGGRGR